MADRSSVLEENIQKWLDSGAHLPNNLVWYWIFRSQGIDKHLSKSIQKIPLGRKEVGKKKISRHWE